MSQIRPFRAWRPRPGLAAQIASPPYDVLSSQEARQMAKGNELSYLHVVKPEIDLDASIDPYDPRVHEQGARNLQHLIAEGALERDKTPCYYVYQQKMGDHIQAGIGAGASVDEYDAGLIKKHEHTRRIKEDDRTRHVDVLNANSEPVFLTYVARKQIDQIVDEIREREPDYDFVSDDGIGHTLWVVADPGEIQRLTDAFSEIPHMYVADGHHRSASATRVRALRREANPNHRGDEPYNYFLAVIFPHNQMQIMAYNRVVKDLGGKTAAQLLDGIKGRFEIAPADRPAPARARTFGMYLEGRWLRLTAKPGSFPEKDPVQSLDCAILQSNLLQPLLGIEDPRSDERIDFVGGIRGTAELEKRCREGWAVAFALYPTGIQQLMSVADAGKVMPPKSTWFEPKLRSGLIIRPLAD
jgi:uncharacterized protein (DUF1015 family)